MRIHFQYNGKPLFTINLWIIALILFLAVSAWKEHTSTLSYRYKELQPSVVKVNNLKYLGGLITGSTLQEAALGTGTFIDKHYVLTAQHVIVNADGLNVEIDKKIYPATLIWSSPVRDYAVLFVSDYEGTPVKLGDSSKLSVGDSALILGNPYGLLYVLGFGFISAPTQDLENNATYFIQSWTQANPGNSGGGLFNADNELVGVVVRHAENNFDFSVPINEIKGALCRVIAAHKKLLDNITYK